MPLKKIVTMCTLIMVIVGLITGLFTLDARYAKASEVQEIKQALNKSIDNGEANAIEQRLWRLEDRHGGLSKFEQWPSDVRQDYREQERRMNELRNKHH